MMTASETFATIGKLTDKAFLSGVRQLVITYITSADRPVLTSGPIASKGFLFHMNQLMFSLKNQIHIKSKFISNFKKKFTK